MSNERAEQVRRIWRERRGVQAWARGGPPRFRRHYLESVNRRLRSALADLRESR